MGGFVSRPASVEIETPAREFIEYGTERNAHAVGRFPPPRSSLPPLSLSLSLSSLLPPSTSPGSSQASPTTSVYSSWTVVRRLGQRAEQVAEREGRGGGLLGRGGEQAKDGQN
ncbi:hypothetical protein XA68_16917 [Ophiocordyceps unilateralis]|uniref:Uncharacterized protein n=1 Tax=Ophiocordyceps unilateralis TaxID=268505 RepID=A0A2A9P4T3_OPHUN|nr:hypothetical protein XA68_16917 [Ophiocordyceps unilateralis]